MCVCLFVCVCLCVCVFVCVWLLSWGWILAVPLSILSCIVHTHKYTHTCVWFVFQRPGHLSQTEEMFCLSVFYWDLDTVQSHTCTLILSNTVTLAVHHASLALMSIVILCGWLGSKHHLTNHASFLLKELPFSKHVLSEYQRDDNEIDHRFLRVKN